MEPLDFIKVAKQLLRYNNEAKWRTSIGRSYYAIFNYLKNEIYSLGITISKGPAGHGELVKNFHGCGIDEAIEIGSKVRDLYTQRIIADYEMDDTVTQNTASLIFKKAKEITEVFPKIDKPTLKTKIEAYIRTITPPHK